MVVTLKPSFNGVEPCLNSIIKIYALSGAPDFSDYDDLNNAGFDGIYFKSITHETKVFTVKSDV